MCGSDVPRTVLLDNSLVCFNFPTLPCSIRIKCIRVALLYICFAIMETHTHIRTHTVFGMHGYMFIKNVGDDGGKSNNSNNIKIQNIFCGWLMLCAWPMIFFAPYTLHAKRYFDKSQPIPKILEKILILCLFLSFSIGLKSLRPCSYIDMNYFVYKFSVWFFFFFRHLENHKYHDLSNFERLFMVWHGGDTGQSVFVK